MASKRIKIPNTVGEFIQMAEEADAVAEAFDPFMGVSTSDKLPGYFGAGAAAAALVGLATKSHDPVVTVACVVGLVLLALGCAFLNAWALRERHRTVRVAHVVPGEVEHATMAHPDDVG